MDISKEFFEMCGKATEIQENHKIVSGDYFNGDEICEDIFECKNDEGYLIKSIYGKWFLPSECVWLPRQDQLQDMLTELSPKGRFVFLMKWMDESLWCNKRLNCDTSAEIIWLVCIMDRKFNKEWDGKEWIKKND